MFEFEYVVFNVFLKNPKDIQVTVIGEYIDLKIITF